MEPPHLSLCLVHVPTCRLTNCTRSSIEQMHGHGLLRTDEAITRFFKVATECCVDLTYKLIAKDQQQNQQAHGLAFRRSWYITIDAFVKMAAMMVRLSDGGRNPQTKIDLLRKVRREFFFRRNLDVLFFLWRSIVDLVYFRS